MEVCHGPTNCDAAINGADKPLIPTDLCSSLSHAHSLAHLWATIFPLFMLFPVAGTVNR